MPCMLAIAKDKDWLPGYRRLGSAEKVKMLQESHFDLFHLSELNIPALALDASERRAANELRSRATTITDPQIRKSFDGVYLDKPGLSSKFGLSDVYETTADEFDPSRPPPSSSPLLHHL